MKAFFFYYFLAVNICQIFAQESIQCLGIGIAGQSSKGEKIEHINRPFPFPSFTQTNFYQIIQGRVNIHYQGLHQLVKSKYYLSHNSIFNIVVRDGYFTFGQRIGLAFKNHVNDNTCMFFNVGAEANLLALSGISYGMYASPQFLVKKNRSLWLISPEINVLYSPKFAPYLDIYTELKKAYFLGLGINVGMAWNRKKVPYLEENRH